MNIFIQDKWAEVMREDDSPLFLFNFSDMHTCTPVYSFLNPQKG